MSNRPPDRNLARKDTFIHEGWKGAILENENVVQSAAAATAEIVKAVPIYQDLVQPAAKELGIGLGQIVRVALAPIRLYVLGLDRLEGYVTARLTEKLDGVPPERIMVPPTNVAVPALQAISYTATTEPDLAELYANLLATAMDTATAQKAHPAFVAMIQQMTPDEGRILPLVFKYKQLRVVEMPVPLPEPVYDEWREGFCDIFTSDLSCLGCLQPDLLSAAGENLARLGLIDFSGPRVAQEGWSLQSPRVEKCPPLANAARQLGPKPTAWFRGLFRPTALGKQFLDACYPAEVSLQAVKTNELIEN